MSISSHLPDVVDAYIAMRAQRLQADKQAASLKEQEDILKDHLISSLRHNGMSALGGKAGMVKLGKSEEPEPLDWAQIWAYMKQNDAMELVQKRLGSTAVKERWEAGEQIPGIGKRDVYKLSVSGA